MILATITGFLGRYLNIVVIAGTVMLATTASVFYWQWSSEAARAEKLQIEKDRLAAAAEILNQVIVAKDEAIAELEATTAALNTQVETSNSLIEEARNAPASDDGPVAPVLGRMLRKLDGVRQYQRSPAR